MDGWDMLINPSNRNETTQKLEVGNLYINVSDREMCSSRFKIEIHEYIYLVIPPSRRLASSSSDL
jgi:hypothetical protein